MPVVQMPDGQLVDMPDQISPEQQAQLQAVWDKANPSLWSKVKQTGASMVAGFGKTIGEGAQAVAPMLPIPDAGVAGLSRAGKTAEDYWKKFGQEHGLPDGYGKIAAEGAGAGISSGPAGLRSLLIAGISGAGGATGSEAAARLGGDNAITRVAGGLAGGLASGAAAGKVFSKASRNVHTLAKEATEGLTDDQLEQAAEFMKHAQAQGITVDLAQALHAIGVAPSNVTALRNYLANSKHGNITQKTLREQPTQLQDMTNATVEGLPGQRYHIDAAAEIGQRGATQYIEGLRTQRTNLWEEVHDGVKTALTDKHLKSLAEANGEVRDAMNRLKALQTRFGETKDRLDFHKGQDQLTYQQQVWAQQEAYRLIDLLNKWRPSQGRTNPGIEGQFRIDRAHHLGQARTLAPTKPMTSARTSQAAVELDAIHHQGVKTADELDTATGKVKAAQGNLDALESVDPGRIREIQSQLRAVAAQNPNTGVERSLLRLAAGLQKGDYPLTDPNQINNFLKSEAARLKDVNLASEGIDIGASKFIGRHIQMVREKLGETSEPVREANKAYRQFTDETLNPAKASATGRLATRWGYQPDKSASMDNLEQLFAKGTDSKARGTSPILTVARDLQKVDPTAFPNMAKSWIGHKLSQVTPAKLDQAATQDSAYVNEVYKTFFEKEAQQQGMRDIAAGIARNAGVPEHEVVRGVDNLQQMVKALTSRPMEVSGLSRADIKQMAENSGVAHGVRMFGMVPFGHTAMKINDAIYGSTLRKLDSLLTTPEGIKTLRELGRVPVMSKRAASILATFTSTSHSLNESFPPGVTNP